MLAISEKLLQTHWPQYYNILKTRVNAIINIIQNSPLGEFTKGTFPLCVTFLT